MGKRKGYNLQLQKGYNQWSSKGLSLDQQGGRRKGTRYPHGWYASTRVKQFILKIQEMLSTVFCCSKIQNKTKTPSPHTDETIKSNRKLIPQIMNSKAAVSSAAVN